MRKFTLPFVIGCGLLTGVARANLTYDFNINPAVGSSLGAPGATNAFSFSFTVSNFVGDGQGLAFAPFDITDGTHTWTMINGLTGHISGTQFGCFMFDTGGNSSIQPPCGFGVGGPPDGGLLLVVGTPQASQPLPTAVGFYPLWGAAVLDFSGSPSGLVLSPAGTLDVTGAAVPEPATLSLFGIVMAAVFLWKRSLRLGGPSKSP
jgi:hypothetical protein